MSRRVRSRAAWQAVTKVPKITATFWIIKVLTTGMGEVTSDYLAHRFGSIPAVMLGGFGFVAAIALQFSMKRYVAWAYWLAVVMVAIFGTMAADGLHVQLGVPYAVSTPFYAVVLAVVFFAWFKSEKTLSIHSVYTKRREAFYWATILATFALGTAAGDMTAVTMHWGYLTSGIIFAGVIALPALAYWKLHLNEVFAFWFAYVITRPLGASFADWATAPHSAGGLNISRGAVSLTLAIIIALFVGFLSFTHKDLQGKQD